MKKLYVNGTLLCVLIIIQGCSIISREERLSPRLEDYKDQSNYKASVQDYSGFDDSLRYVSDRYKRINLSGDWPEIVLTSQDYQFSLSTSKKSSRTVALGPCFIPLPVIPLFERQKDFLGYMTIIGKILSLNGQSFTLGRISAQIGIQEIEHIKVLDQRIIYEQTSDEAVDEGDKKGLTVNNQSLSFMANIPMVKSSVDNLKVNVRVIEESGQEITLPTVNFYSSWATVWAVCVL